MVKPIIGCLKKANKCFRANRRMIHTSLQSWSWNKKLYLYEIPRIASRNWNWNWPSPSTRCCCCILLKWRTIQYQYIIGNIWHRWHLSTIVELSWENIMNLLLLFKLIKVTVHFLRVNMEDFVSFHLVTDYLKYTVHFQY